MTPAELAKVAAFLRLSLAVIETADPEYIIVALLEEFARRGLRPCLTFKDDRWHFDANKFDCYAVRDTLLAALVAAIPGEGRDVPEA
jgi:hypothetical protein